VDFPSVVYETRPFLEGQVAVGTSSDDDFVCCEVAREREGVDETLVALFTVVRVFSTMFQHDVLLQLHLPAEFLLALTAVVGEEIDVGILKVSLHVLHVGEDLMTIAVLADNE
jgi:hypothetical protein